MLEEREMTTWLTSDQHYAHHNIIKYSNRPFANIDEMTEELVRRFNERVTNDDLVWHLGDFSLRECVVRPILARLNGRHSLVAGNHDACHRRHRGWQTGASRYIGYGFEQVHQGFTLEIAGQHVLLTHMPYLRTGDHEGRERDKYDQYRPEDKGGWLLHGHIHQKWRQNGRMLNVGVDAWKYRPVSLEEVAQLIRLGPANSAVEEIASYERG